MNEINRTPGTGSGQAGTQLLLWDSPSLDPLPRLKAAMRDALKNCSLSREKIVADMNELAAIEGMTCNGNAQKISEPLLDKWVASGSDAHVIPLRYLPLFCRAVGSLLPLKALAATIGAEIIGTEERKLLEWARAESRRRESTKEARRLAQEVGLK